MFYRLGEPKTQPGMTGVLFPVEWSAAAEPWLTEHVSSVLVPGFVDASGVLQLDEAALDAALAEEQARLEAAKRPVTLSPKLRARVDRAARVGRKDVAS